MGNKRWVYFYLNASVVENSVQKKIRGQISMLVEHGLNMRGVFFIYEDEISEDMRNKYDKIDFVSKGIEPTGYFRSIKSIYASTRAFRKWLDTNSDKFDMIYLRHYSSSVAQYRVSRIYGKIMAVEFQTKNIYEILSRYKENPFGLRPGLFLSWVEFQLVPVLRELFVQPLISRKLKAVVGVTEEIARFVCANALFKNPMKIVVTNGVHVDEFVEHVAPPLNNEVVRLVMLIGAAPGSEWNGVDLVIEGIRKYTGEVRIELHIVGSATEARFEKDDFIFRHGYLSGPELEDVLGQCHLALGAFGLGRKKLIEGSTLKMREYAGRGIPCVYGHFDSDYEELCEIGLALRLPNDLVPDFSRIIDFVRGIYEKSDFTNQIRQHARRKMDFSVKMQDLKTALDKL